ncbi:unannotated protein [freshwater metagenome]|uniref:Unannotated protein n=1 Tax=freshwater metagenome TaxID=449393 RepID=A0A6J7ELK1_9ZZZZ
MLIVGLFFHWASYAGYSANNAFDYFFTGGIAWILIVGAGIVTFLLTSGTLKTSGVQWPVIVLLATGLGALLMLIRLILGGGSEGNSMLSIDLDRAAGMYLAFVASGVSVAGAFMGFTASGGKLDDLKDINKLKASFNQGGGETPAPPSSSGSTPPPPPPPSGSNPPPPPPPAG